MNETTVQETIQYPAWQQVIRDAQAKEQAALEARLEKQDAEAREWNLKHINEMRGKLAELGLMLPENETGIWEQDGYTLQVMRSRNYDRLLFVKKAVPDAVAYSDEYEGLWDCGYRNMVSCQPLYISNITGGDIATALDEVDNLVIQQIETNRIAVEKMEERRLQIEKRQPEPKTEPTLEDLIRAIVREEMGVVRDSQWESLL